MRASSGRAPVCYPLAVAILPWVLLLFLSPLSACTPGDQELGTFRAEFNDYRGSRASLPENMFVTGEDGDGRAISDAFYPFTGAHIPEREDEFNGFGAFTVNREQYSFGIRERGEPDLRNARLFLEYQNRTDRTIVGFTVSYEVEAWMKGERDNRIRLKYHTDTSGFSAVDSIVSTTNPSGAAASEDEVGTVLDGSREENRTTVRVSFALSELTGDPSQGFEPYHELRPGDTGYLRWQYSNDRIRDGSHRSALAINNIEVKPIFEDESADWSRRSGDKGATQPPAALRFDRHPGLLSDDSLLLGLSSTIDGAEIYYTLDGSRPDPQYVISDAEWEGEPRETRRRTFRYDDPIDLAEELRRENDIASINTSEAEGEWAWRRPEHKLQKAAIVRAVAVSEDTRSSYHTKTFLPSPDLSSSELPSLDEPIQLPIFSIATNRANLFCAERGIYVFGEAPAGNYRQRGREWEREAHMELFEDGSRVMRQDLGLRIHGGFSRALPQKTLRLYSRSDYGTSRLNHRFFESKDIDDFNRLLLRNGSNDWIRTMLSDPVMQTLVQHLEFDTQHYRPVVLFLNGEYWGIHNMRDRHDHHFLETHYGVPRDEVAIVEHDGPGGENQELLHTGTPGDEHVFQEFRRRLVAGEVSTRTEVEEYMVIESFLEYLIAQVYAGNYDWPMNNMRYWRYTGADTSEEEGPRDGRWRWLMHDMTRSFGHSYTLQFNAVDWVFGDAQEPHPYFMQDGRDGHEQPFEFIQALIAIDEIRLDLLGRFALHLETTFKVDRVKQVLDETIARVEDEAPHHIARWGQPESMDEWYQYVEEMYEAARLRPDIVRDHLMAEFDEIEGNAAVTLVGIAGDGYRINSLPLTSSTPGVEITDSRWEGQLFAGVPVQITSEQGGLDGAQIGPSEHVRILERSEDHLSFVPTGAVEVRLQ